MRKTQLDYLAGYVLDILKEDPNRTWQQDQLTREVLNRLSYTNANRVKTVIKTVCGTGTVVTNSNRTSLRYKETPEDIEHTLQKKLSAKEDECERLRHQNKGIAEIHIKQNGRKTVVLKDTFHAKFPHILTLAKARKNIFLYGPTGCGKSHLGAQVAKHLKLKFYFVSCSAGMSEGILGGKLLPTGKQGTFEYIISEFVKAYEEGGVFLIDEIDAADANVLLVINAALANGKMAVPNRPANPYATKHKNFVCIAAANTIGLGADRQYSGRNRLDDATMDRFRIGKVYMDYDDEVERHLCPDDELRLRLQRYRHNMRSARLERAMSSRFMMDAHEMKHDWDWSDELIDEVFFTGWKESEIRKAKGAA